MDAFAVDVLAGLGAPKQKSIPFHHLYDARGSELFEAIIEQPEYYLSRAEISILEARAADIVAGMPPGSVLVEFGSGSSRKTEILLNAVVGLAAYVPIDVSASALAGARQRLAAGQGFAWSQWSVTSATRHNYQQNSHHYPALASSRNHYR